MCPISASEVGADLSVRYVKLSTSLLRVASTGSGPPLLMINGLGAAIEMWRPLATHLAKSRRLIMFDAPGTGRSPTHRWPMRMSGLSRMVVELLDELDLDVVDVLGYSWGGALAQQLARDAPRRVRRLVLASTTAGMGCQPPSPMVLAVMSSPLRFGSASYLTRVAPLIYGGDARLAPLARELPLDAWLARPPTRRGYLNQLYAISTWSSLPWLHTVAAPTLVVQGDDDPLVPNRTQRMITRRLPNATRHVAHGAGHLWLLERPQTAADVIDRFLTGDGRRVS